MPKQSARDQLWRCRPAISSGRHIEWYQETQRSLQSRSIRGDPYSYQCRMLMYTKAPGSKWSNTFRTGCFSFTVAVAT